MTVRSLSPEKSNNEDINPPLFPSKANQNRAGKLTRDLLFSPRPLVSSQNEWRNKKTNRERSQVSPAMQQKDVCTERLERGTPCSCVQKQKKEDFPVQAVWVTNESGALVCPGCRNNVRACRSSCSDNDGERNVGWSVNRSRKTVRRAPSPCCGTSAARPTWACLAPSSPAVKATSGAAAV